MKCTALFETIDQLNESYLSFWEDVCNIESPTTFKKGVDAVGSYFIEQANLRGWQVEIFEQPVAGNVVCITLNPHADAAPICFSGHMDTVHPIGLFGTPPVRRDHEKIYGPGVTDCKGGIVAAFMAMDALDRCGFTTRPVQLLLQSDEEGGSSVSGKATIRSICERAKDSVAFLNLECYTPGKACLVRKGIVTYTLTITGIEAHSSHCATEGASAILEAAHKIIELEQMKDADGLTCNCGVIRGGSVPNTVPGFCEVKANIRFATQEQLDWVQRRVQEIADTVHVPGCTCEVTCSGNRVAMELQERNLSLLDTMNRIYRENSLPELEMSKQAGGSDAADVTACGIPCIDSLGVRGGDIHSPAEYAWLDSLAESAKLVASVAYCI